MRGVRGARLHLHDTYTQVTCRSVTPYGNTKLPATSQLLTVALSQRFCTALMSGSPHQLFLPSLGPTRQLPHLPFPLRSPPHTQTHDLLPPGYGITCVLEDGQVLEKAAANISVVRGTLSAARAAAMSSRGRGTIDPAGGQPYAAAAMSLVFHSAHPLIPTLRADVRLFQVGWAVGYGKARGRVT